jgi:hypothetical protein
LHHFATLGAAKYNIQIKAAVASPQSGLNAGLARRHHINLLQGKPPTAQSTYDFGASLGWNAAAIAPSASIKAETFKA